MCLILEGHACLKDFFNIDTTWMCTPCKTPLEVANNYPSVNVAIEQY